MLKKKVTQYQHCWTNYKGVKVGFVPESPFFVEYCVGDKAKNGTQWFQPTLSALPLFT